MIRRLVLALVVSSAAAPVSAAPCVPGTLADYIGLRSTGCELVSRWVPSTLGWVRDFDFEVLDVGGGLDFAPEDIAVSMEGGYPGAPMIGMFDSPEAQEVGFIEYRIGFAADMSSPFSALDFSLFDASSSLVEADVELCIGEPFVGGVCPALLLTFSLDRRGYEHTDFPPTSVIGFRQTFRLSGPAVDCDVESCASGDFRVTTLTSPEPSSVVLLGMALVGFALRSWRRL